MDVEYHEGCSKKFFGSKIPPELNYSQDEMLDLATKVVKSQKTVTGVQPKLSLNIEKYNKGTSYQKLTIVGLWGQYILKPQTKNYPELPEIEDLTMKLAESVKIQTVPHSLIRLKSGELAYITKRIDRIKNKKLHMEDMCQLTERQTEHKYKGSHEHIAKAIKRFSEYPGLDIVNFYEQVLFCYLTGNNDMHLKNFSLLKNVNGEYSLSPAYDLVASELVVEGDDEELALNLNGKKKKLKRSDFQKAMYTAGINDKAIDNIFQKFNNVLDQWMPIINNSFLSGAMKEKYIEMLVRKVEVFR